MGWSGLLRYERAFYRSPEDFVCVALPHSALLMRIQATQDPRLSALSSHLGSLCALPSFPSLPLALELSQGCKLLILGSIIFVSHLLGVTNFFPFFASDDRVLKMLFHEWCPSFFYYSFVYFV